MDMGGREGMEPAEHEDQRARRPSGGEGGSGTAGLSAPARVAVSVAVVCVAAAAVFHIAMVFLHVAPQNAISEKHDEAIDDYIYPEFEQNWKLFAPNPLQQNIAVHARARVAKPDGSTEITGWVDLSAMDGRAIRHNVAPSHTQQNELRRGWEFFVNSHDENGKPRGLRGELSQSYVKRIVMWRFGPRLNGGTVERVQLRQAVTPVAPPEWSRDGGEEERESMKTEYRGYPWWQVTSADLPGSPR